MLATMISSAMKLVVLACVVVPAVAQQGRSIRRLDGTVISANEAESVAAAELKADGVTGAQIAILNHGHPVWSYGVSACGMWRRICR